MAFMLSMADVEKARSIAERYYLSYFASCPFGFRTDAGLLDAITYLKLTISLIGGASTKGVNFVLPSFCVISCSWSCWVQLNCPV